MRKNYVVFYLSASLFLLLFAIVLPIHVYAASLSLFPAIIPIVATHFPIEKQIMLTNTSEKPEQIEMQILPMKQGLDGNAILLAQSRSDKQTKQLLHTITIDSEGGATPIGENGMILLPGETKKLLVQIGKGSKEAIARDYYFSIVFISKDVNKPNTTNSQIHATVTQQASIASLFLITNGQKAKSAISAALHTPSVSFTSGVSPLLLLENKSKHLSALSIHETVRGLFGVIYLDQYISSRYVFSQSRRSLALTSFTMPFPYIGPTFINITINDTLAGSKREVSKEVFILPAQILGLIAASIIGILFVASRVKNRLNR